MANNRLPHVLLLYRRIIPSIRLCGHCQMQALEEKGLVEYRARQDMRVANEDLAWADVVLLGRLDSWYELQLTRRMRQAGKYLIYILDDDLLNVPIEISSAAYYNQPQIQRYIRQIIDLSDAILSPSPLLHAKYALDSRLALRIEEPAIEPLAYVPHAEEAAVKIGFAGSADRTGDIARILGEVLPRLKEEYGGRIEFEFFGAIPPFAQNLGAKTVAYQSSYDEYRRTLNALEWDIGLAPMVESPFHACKHYNKFVEYAAAGIVGVFSDVQPYVRIKETLELDELFTGNDVQQWYETLKRLIDDRERREALRKELCALACGPYSVESAALELYRELEKNGILAKEGGAHQPRAGLLLRGVGLMHRVYSFLYKYEMRRRFGKKGA